MLYKTLKPRNGQGLVEYIMIVALIAIAVFVVVKAFGTTVSSTFTNVGSEIKDNLQNTSNN